MGTIYRRITALFASVLFCFPVLSQQSDNYNFQYYTTADGLPANDISKTITDNNGFLWIATHNGVSRFDGHEFINYTYIPGDTTTLRSIWATDLLLDDKNTVWVTTEWGICYYDQQADRFRYINSKDSITILYKAPIIAGKNGVIWVAAESGLYKIDSRTKTILPTSLKRITDPQCITEDASGNLIIGTRGDGIYYYDPLANSAGKIVCDGIDPSAHYIASVFYEGAVWFASSEGFVEIDQHKKASLYATAAAGLPAHEGEQLLSCLPYTDNGISYFLSGTYDKRIVLFDIHKRLFVPANSLIKQTRKELSGSTIYNMQKGKQVFWISTQRGLYKLSRMEEGFYPANTLLKGSDSTLLMLQNIQKDIKNTDRYLFFSEQENGSLLIYDQRQQQVTKRVHGKSKLTGESTAQSALLQDNTGRIFTFAGQFVNIFSADALWQKEIPTGRIITAASFDRSGNIWMGTADGLCFLDIKSSQVTHFDCSFRGTDVEQKSFWFSFATSNIYTGDDNKIWLTSDKFGLFDFDKSTHTFTAHRQPFSGPYETLNRCTGIVAIGPDLWVSNMAGLTVFHRQTGQFENYNISHGLKSTYIYSICLTKNGIIWGRGNIGLFNFNPVSKNFQNYLLPGPLNESYYIQNVFADGESCLLGLPGKFARFTLREATPNSPIFLNNLSFRESKIVVTQLENEIPFVTLKNEQNDLHIDFTTPDFSGEPVYYSYMLEGIDTRWTDAGKKHEVNYFNLPPGTYAFKVRCRKGEESWGKEQHLLSIKINPAFWQTAWFRVLVILIIAGILYLLYKRRIDAIRKRQKGKNYQQQLEIEKYKQELELEQVTSFFSGSLINKNNAKDVLNEVAKNLIGKLGFEDCMIYLWNDNKTKMIQHAGYGIKGEVENLTDTEKYNIEKGKGIIGAAVQTGKPLLVNDTTKDNRYINADNKLRKSELCVPLVDDGEVIGAINIEQTEVGHFTLHHQQIVTAIATMIVNKLKAVQSTQSLYQKELELSQTNRQLAETELAMLRSQMNPHFIFNSLNSVQKYIWENKEEDAAEYLAKFARLMRAILENSRKDRITVREEIDTMKIYTDLEHRRSNGRFDYTIRIGTDIDPDNTLIPPLILQPFIENAIWHGLSRKESKGHLTILVNRESDTLVCVIEDDGVGRSLVKESVDGKRSLGIEITRQRIEHLMHHSSTQPVIRIIDKKENNLPTGTKVIITLPLQISG